MGSRKCLRRPSVRGDLRTRSEREFLTSLQTRRRLLAHASEGFGKCRPTILKKSDPPSPEDRCSCRRSGHIDRPKTDSHLRPALTILLGHTPLLLYSCKNPVRP